MQQTLSQRYLTAKRMLFEKAYESLNPRQQEAVFHVNGPLLILAGAGSGKTTVLVRRIAFLIRYGNAYFSERVPQNLTEDRVRRLEDAADTLTSADVLPILDEFAENPCPPYRVLAITFTNKAANEIKERLATMFSDTEMAGEIWSGTFHSVCLRILRRYGDLLGYRAGFSIYDVDDSKKAAQEAMRRANIDEKLFPVKAVLNTISRAKDKLLTPEEFELETGNDFRLKQIAKIYSQYQMLLRESNAMDFDDIIMQTVLLLRNRPEVAENYQKQFRYICVDEYQDTNPAQFELTRLLSAGSGNLMVVGDDDQSIYKFRGATIENILSFNKTYSHARVIRLEQNYRSTQNILDAANAVIDHNSGRMGKTLWTSRGEGELIRLIQCEDQNEEARRVVDIIQKQVATGSTYRDFAVLYRMNAQSQTLEKAFARAGVPYRMLGALRFTDRKEIRDAVAYLQLLVNSGDNVRLNRIINEPRRKIGNKTLEAVAILAEEQNCSQFEIIERARQFTALKNACPMLEGFADLIHDLKSLSRRVSLSALFDAVLDRSGYRQMLIAGGEAEADRLQNLEEFKSQIMDYEKESENPSLQEFLEETALVADVDRYDEEADAVVMMTVHSAKGLEFPTVILPGMEDGIFPGMQTIEGGNSELEEERRLAYVAITRAKTRLYVLHTSQRMLFGRTTYNPISRFISEIPQKLLEKEKPAYGGGVRGTVGSSHGSGYGSSYGGQSRSVYGAYGAGTPITQKKTYYSETASKPAASAAKPTPQKSAPAEIFKAGDRVRHFVFGEGEIISVKPMGTDTLYEIMFDRAGTKKLRATYAKLKREN